jgi:hypothetical protein
VIGLPAPVTASSRSPVEEAGFEDVALLTDEEAEALLLQELE